MLPETQLSGVSWAGASAGEDHPKGGLLGCLCPNNQADKKQTKKKVLYFYL
jgi:hypothetical protein